ncbi:MAG: gliding motility-associated C-terminal domain-containing protein [Chitinophagales bacterium]
MKKQFYSLLSAVAFLLVTTYSSAQVNVYLEVDPVDAAQTGGDCGDCNGSPDPSVDFHVKHSGVGAYSGTYNSSCTDCGCGSYTPFSPTTNYTASGVLYTNTINIELNGQEVDGFVCGAADGDCGGWGAPNAGSNNVLINSVGACSFTGNYNSGRTGCSSDGSTNDYNARWRFRYYFESGYTAGSIGSSQTICSGTAPASFTNVISPTTNNSGVQWYSSTDLLTWNPIGGANGNTYTSGTLTQTTYFRRDVTFCTNFSGGTTTVSSNVITITVTQPVGAAGAITGNTAICAGATGQVYSIAAVSNATTYTWSVPAGASITSGQGSTTIQVTFGSNSGSVSVVPSNGCFSGAASSLAVTIQNAIGSVGAISGPATVCSGQNNVVYSIGSVTNATTYTWAVPSGASIQLGQGTTSVTVNFGSSTGGSITVQPSNACFTGSTASKSITVTPALGATGTISGLGSVCAGQTGVTYTTGTVTAATTYTWTVPSGATFTGQGTTSITVNWGTATSGNITMTPSNSCFSGIAASTSVTVTPNVGTTGVITGDTTICYGDNGVPYSISPVSGATNYFWTVPSGASISAGQGSNSISVNYLTASSGVISVTPSNSCFTGAASNLNVVVTPQLGTASSISGNNTPCFGATETYSLPAVTGASDYQWTVPSGASISLGQGTNSISVNLGTATSGSISVVPSNDCFTGSAVSLPLTITPALGSLGAISGSDSICFGANPVGFSTLPIAGATLYSWTVPAGANVISGQGSTSITVDFGTALSGNVSVQASNVCFNTSTSKFVKVNPIPQGGISGTATICQGGTDTIVFNFTNGTAPFNVTYTDGTNAFNLTAINSGYTVVVNPGSTTTYTLQQISDAGGCTRSSLFNSAAKVTVAPQPTINSVSSTDALCNGSANGTITISASGGTSPISYSVDNGTNYSFTNNFTGLLAGNYNVVIRDSLGCSAVYVVNPVVISEPSVLDVAAVGLNPSCAGVSNGTITASGTGGTPGYSYSLNGGPSQFSNVFNSQPAGSYLVTIIDSHGCQDTVSVNLSNSYVVNAVIDTQVNVSCFGGNNGSVTILFTGGVSPLSYSLNGGIAQALPTFTGLSAGTYTIVAKDANSCSQVLNVGISQPALLSVQLDSISNNLCNGNSNGTIYITPVGGTAPYSFSWSNGTGNEDLTNVGAGTYNVTVFDANNCTASTGASVSQPLPLFLSVASFHDVNCKGDSTGEIDITANGGVPPYKFNWSTGDTTEDRFNLAPGNYGVTVIDANGCQKSLTQIVSEPASVLAASATSDSVTCFGAANGAVSLTVSGGTTPYSYGWSNGATTPNLTTISGGNYSVTVRDHNNCTAFVSAAVFEPQPITLTFAITNSPCAGSTIGAVDLTVHGGTPSFSYNWSNGATTEDLVNVGGGNYHVTVTDSKNCIKVDSARVIQSNSVFTGTLVTTNISCFGANDGKEEVFTQGGTAPLIYQWSISNIPGISSITNLGPGTYSVTVKDANGCSFVRSDSVIEPALLIASATGSALTCNNGTNGTVTSTVSGGTAPYNYLWSNFATTANLSNVGAGNYTVIVTDKNGCTASASASVTSPAALGLTFTVRDVACKGSATGMVRVTASGGSGSYSYSWTGGSTLDSISNVVAGSYSVTVTDGNGCSNSGTATVNEPANSLVASSSHQDISCNGKQDGRIDVTVNGGGTPYVFNWSNGASTEDLSGLAAGNYSVSISDANGCSVTLSETIAEPAAISASATGSALTCNNGTNGTVTSTVSGGTAPYNYLWSNFATTANLSNVGAGNYTVIVTDKNGCTASASASVTSPAALGLTFTVRDVACKGSATGMVRVTASGGSGSYSYSWTGGFTLDSISNVVAGSYSVTVTDGNGCSNSGTATVNEPANSLVASSSHQDISCNGKQDGRIDVTVNGGGTPYVFNWSNGASTEDLSGLAAGNYSVSISDANGCSVILNETIAEPAAISASATGSALTCNNGTNGTVTSTVSGGTAPYNYLWSNFATTANLSNVGAGNYTVIVTDKNGCTASASASVTSPAALGLMFTVRDVACKGSATGMVRVTASGGSGSYSYSWTGGSTLDSISNVVAGSYSVTVTDGNGCSNSGTATVNEPANSLVASSSHQDISCNGKQDGRIDVTVNGGGTPYVFNWSNGASTEDLSGLAAGNYSVSISDANGCSVTLSETIAEPAAISASATGSALTCNNGTNGTVTSTVSGGTAPYNYLWSNFATTANLSNVGAGNYTVIVTDKNGCTASASASVTSPAALGLTFTVRDVACKGSATGMVRVTASGGSGSYSYSWTGGSTLDSISNVVAGSYSVTVTDGNGCSNSGTATVNEPANSLVASSSHQDISCNGKQDGRIDVTVNGGGTPYVFNWSNGASTEDLSGLAAGNYSVSISDANGCSVTLSETIAEPAAISSSIAGTNVTCHGQNNGAANLTVSGGAAPLTFLWSNFSASEDLNQIGGGWFTVIITDANGCQHRDSVNIIEPQAISVTHTVSQITCHNANNGSIDLTVAGGTLPLTYTWSNGAATEDINSLASGMYGVTVKDFNNCQVIDSAQIINPSVLSINHLVTTPRCNASGDGAINLIVNGGTYPYSYLWSNGSSNEDLSNLNGGAYKVTVTDSKGCSATDSIFVVEPDGIVITSIIKNVTCNGDKDGVVDLSVYYGTPPYNYQWYSGSLGGTPLTINEDLRNLSGGTYCVSVTDSKGCPASLCADVKEADSLKIVLNKVDASCQSNSGSVSVAVTGGVVPYEYLWNNFVTTASQSNVAGGLYTVIVTDSNGCHLNGSITVNGQPNPMFTTVSVSNPTCSGGDNGFVSVAVSGGAIPYSYSWNTTGQTGNVATNLSDGSYIVTITDASGCQAVDSGTIKSPAPISISTSASGTTCVSTKNGKVVVTASGGKAPYLYILNGITQSNDTFGQLTAGTYTVIVRDANGCEGMNTFSVIPSSSDSVDLTVDAEVVLKGQQIHLNATTHSDTTVTGLVWMALDSLDFSACGDPANCTNPTQYPQSTQTIVVTMTNARGCSASDTVRIEVRTEAAIFMPTAFTPNGDGLNDRFQFAILGAKSGNMQVFNRWGEKVYDDPEQPNGIDQNKAYGWDGTFRGKQCEFDTYTYQLEITYLDGHKEMKNGTITLMR